MYSTDIAILCLAYILGLLSTNLTGIGFVGVPLGGWAVFAVGVMAAIIVPRWWRTGPKFWLWLVAGVIGMLATLYFQFRTPQPAANDISRFVPKETIEIQSFSSVEQPLVIVSGQVASTPRLTRSGKAQFWLEATGLNEIIAAERPTSEKENKEDKKSGDLSQGVSGKLYVTTPLLQATGLHPGLFVTMTGLLYKPQPPANVGAFDFRAYLAKEGCFAGFRARQVTVPPGPGVSKFGWWALRRRIVRSQVDKLGVPEGPLVSAMTLGKETVDLPFDIRDSFTQVGLAHALAASGAQVCLILTVVLALTKGFSPKIQFGVGLTDIAVFVGLAGLEASVCRAALMGVGALLALVTERKVKPLGSLLLAATVLLLFNPRWIGDIGFDLSFLATLGLLVTVPGLTARLDWLPPAIASLIAVPLAASIWTLPLQLYVFNVVSPYSILVNILASPFIAVISLGGFVSAFVGFISPPGGSVLASVLYYPAHWLIAMVEFFSKLPGNSVAVGSLSIVQLGVLYGLIGLVWSLSVWQEQQEKVSRFKKGKRKKVKSKNKKNSTLFTFVVFLCFSAAVAVVVVPGWHTKLSVSRVSVLATGNEPVLVVEDKGVLTLINSGDENGARFTVLPFFQERGVNHVDWVLATDVSDKAKSGWELIFKSLPVKNVYGVMPPSEKGSGASQGVFYQVLPVGDTVPLGSGSVRVLSNSGPVVLLQILGQNWLLLGDLKGMEQEQLAKSLKLESLQVLWWSGQELRPVLLDALKPAVAIASSRSLNGATAARLSEGKSQIYWTGRDGGIVWTADGGFVPVLQAGENNNSLL